MRGLTLLFLAQPAQRLDALMALQGGAEVALAHHAGQQVLAPVLLLPQLLLVLRVPRLPRESRLRVGITASAAYHLSARSEVSQRGRSASGTLCGRCCAPVR